jgi:hypothetical protein
MSILDETHLAKKSESSSPKYYIKMSLGYFSVPFIVIWFVGLWKVLDFLWHLI